jgi:hypothetical protein
MVIKNILVFVKSYREVIFAIILVALSRVLPHPPNMVPVTGLAIFSGARIGKKWAIAVPILAMLVSDWVIGFHNMMLYVYGSFVLITILGMLLKSRQKWGKVVGVGICGSFLFYLITNFGVWISGTMYPHNLPGLLDAYYQGLPFFRNTLIGDFLYVNLFFYGLSFSLNFSKKVSILVRTAFS